MRAFHYQSGQFCCEEVSVDSIAERFGTPTYLYSQGAILNNFQRLQRVLVQTPGMLCYSVKANSSLRILNLLRQAGAGFDIVSGGELERVLRVGADPRGVVFSGVGKTIAEIDAALTAGILMFNVESSGELEAIDGRASALGKRANISIRVNPDVEVETHPYISTGEVIHKFGVPKNEAVELYRRATASPHLVIRGVTCHIGSQILEVEPFLEALDEIGNLANSLSRDGIFPEYLDLGGGFGIRYADEQALDFKRLQEGISSRLQGTSYHLVLEPGRSIVGDAGILVTRVLYVKRNPQKNFVVVDAGMNDLMRPTLYGSYHEIVPVQDCHAPTLKADVVGPLCETGDFLAQDRDMADVQPGDLLAILTAGAYGYVLSSNYNTRPRPAEVMVNGKDAELIRPRENLRDLMAGEIL